MKRTFRTIVHGLRFRVMLVLSIGLLIPLLFVATHGMTRIEDRMALDTERLLENTLQQYERQLQSELRKMQHVANVIADDRSVQEILANWNPTDEPRGARYALALSRLRRRVADAKASLLVGYSHDVSIQSPGSVVFTAFEGLGRPHDVLARRLHHISAMADEPTLWNLAQFGVGHFGEDTYLTYTRPMPFPGRAGSGVILISVHAPQLAPLIDTAGEGHLTLVNADGTTITSFGDTSDGAVVDPIVVETPLDLFDASLRYEVSGGTAFAEITRLRHEWIVVLFACFVVAALLAGVALLKVTNPILTLTGRLQTQLTRLKISDATPDRGDEVETLRIGIESLLDRIEWLIDDLMQTERNRQQAHYEALRAQITPHFLFNTLNALRWKAQESGFTEIGEVVASLGYLLEESTTRGPERISLSDELRIVRHFVNIHRFRFDVPVHLETEVPDVLLEYTVPRFILQPIVENSVLHGVRSNSALTIHIEVTQRDSDITIVVRDDGVGSRPDANNTTALRTTGIGLSNVDERLRFTFGPGSGLSFESEPAVGTTVTLTLKGETIVPRSAAG